MRKVLYITIALSVMAAAIFFSNRFAKPLERVTTPTNGNLLVDNTSKDIPKVEAIAKNLEVPWALAFLPDGNILFTERAGKVKLIKKDKPEVETIAIIQVKQAGESGLHGIAVHPNYPQKPYVYLYYTYSAEDNNSLNRVSRFKLNLENSNEQVLSFGNRLIDEQIIVDKIPGATAHDGGRIKFGKDGYLYITTGDAQNPSLSQDKNSLAGKILRVTDEGKSAPGNPFNTLVYSYGHRNPQGITWDSSGRLWATEHGSQATDEINLIEPGKNYGWPIIRGDEKRDELVSPKLHSGSNTWAPAGAAFYRGAESSAYKGSVFFAGLKGQALFEVNLESLELKEHFKGELGRIREVVVGPDNLLYITTSNLDGRGNPKAEDDQILQVNITRLQP